MILDRIFRSRDRLKPREIDPDRRAGIDDRRRRNVGTSPVGIERRQGDDERRQRARRASDATV